MEETLVAQVALLTGLSIDSVKKKFAQIVLASGENPNNLCELRIRKILTTLLQELFVAIKEGQDPQITIR